MNDTLTQLIAAVVAAVVPIIVKLWNDWLDSQKKAEVVAAAGASDTAASSAPAPALYDQSDGDNSA